MCRTRTNSSIRGTSGKGICEMFAKKNEKKTTTKAQALTAAQLEKLAGGGCKGCISRGGQM